MDVLPTRALRAIAAGLGALVLCVAAPPRSAGAASSAFDVPAETVVAITIPASARGADVTIRSWDRPQIQVESDGADPSVTRRLVIYGTVRYPLAQEIPAGVFRRRVNGQDVGTVTLPPEVFPYASFRAGPHDYMMVDVTEPARMTITVPTSTALLLVRASSGKTEIEGYRGANLVVGQGGGRVDIEDSDTTAFVQMNTGNVWIEDSTFRRVRVRVNAAQVAFERCRSTQIEASSVSGTIVYDGGWFEPGLARFDSQSGNIALGVSSPAQVTGRSQGGRVYALFDRRPGENVEQRGENDATAIFGSGGPLVNAVTQRGNVYLYDGSAARGRRERRLPEYFSGSSPPRRPGGP
ncbi:MAG TPA: hypothetical protein VFB22_17165 [Candidatus Baltobacteraceae bacterium]|nr:hypothetical protein [Candidatus Baltobacteraceae bacterium]